MFNIMDLASRYIPKLDQLAAGVSNHYRYNQGASSESSVSVHRRRFRKKVKPRRRKRSFVLIKKKLKLPEAYYGPTHNYNQKRRAMPKLLMRNVRTSKPVEKKKHEQIIRVTKLGSSSQVGVKPHISTLQKKKKSTENTQNKEKATIKKDKSAGMEKALKDFKRKRSMFLVSLKNLQKEISNIKVPPVSSAKKKTVVARKTRSKTKKNKKIKKHKSTDKSEESSSSTSSNTSSDSSSRSSSSSKSSSSTSKSESKPRRKKGHKSRKEQSQKHVETLKLVKGGEGGETSVAPSVMNKSIHVEIRKKKTTPNESEQSFQFYTVNPIGPPDPALQVERMRRLNREAASPLFSQKDSKNEKENISPRTAEQILKDAERNFVFTAYESESIYDLPKTMKETMKESLPRCTVYRGKQ